MPIQALSLAFAAGALLVVLYLAIGRRGVIFEILINAPPKVVWEHWIVACGNNDWRPLIDIQSVERLSEAPLTVKVKAMTRGLMENSVETIWRYDVYEPYRLYHCLAVSSGKPAEESGELTEVGAGTRLQFTITARPAGMAGERFARQRVNQTLQALKQACEHSTYTKA